MIESAVLSVKRTRENAKRGQHKRNLTGRENQGTSGKKKRFSLKQKEKCLGSSTGEAQRIERMVWNRRQRKGT